MTNSQTIRTFQKKILDWFHDFGRHDLPWQKNPTPYRVWISEIMLQQTQVTTVIPYFQAFMRRFPTLKSLALAERDEVLSHWSGLGYYARARNLHKAAQTVHTQHQGRFPRSVEALTALPGIGRSTAGAIASLAMQQSATILDGNVKRVMTRYFAVEGWPGTRAVHDALWALAISHTPQDKTAEYNQAMMDLGATLCTRTQPRCFQCPLQTHCQAHAQGNPTAYPTRKPKTQKPHKKARFLILENAHNAILLQKRPEKGIWGGLWSFPEIDLSTEVTPFVQSTLGCEILQLKALEPFQHIFTHFTLTIHPTHLRIKMPAKSKLAEAELFWYKRGAELPGGVPSPVRKLFHHLEMLRDTHDLLSEIGEER